VCVCVQVLNIFLGQRLLHCVRWVGGCVCACVLCGLCMESVCMCFSYLCVCVCENSCACVVRCALKCVKGLNDSVLFTM